MVACRRVRAGTFAYRRGEGRGASRASIVIGLLFPTASPWWLLLFGSGPLAFEAAEEFLRFVLFCIFPRPFVDSVPSKAVLLLRLDCDVCADGSCGLPKVSRHTPHSLE